MRYIDEPQPFPITKPKTKAGKVAVGLHEEFVRQYGRIGELESAKAAASKVHTDAEIELADALFESERDGGKSTDRVKRAEAAMKAAVDGLSEPWDQRIEAARRATTAAAEALETHIDATLEELLTEPELYDEADKVQALVDEKVKELSEALDSWRSVEDRHSLFLRAAEGLNGQAMPTLPSTVSALRRSVDSYMVNLGQGAGIPAPRPSKRAVKDRRTPATMGPGRF